MIDLSRAGRSATAVVLFLLCSAAASRPARAQQADGSRLQQVAREGERALAEGRYAEAEQAFETLRRLSPRTAEVHARLGLIYFQERKFSEAIPVLRDAINLKPELPKVRTLLAMSLSEMGQYREALPALRAAFDDPADAVLRRLAGLHLQRAYTGLGRDRDAVEVALRLAKLYPADPEVLYVSGRLFANFAYLQTMKLAEVAPDSVWMHQAAGEANESQGLYDAAVREYRAVLAAEPRRPRIHFRIGRTLLEKGKDTRSENAAAAEAAKEFLEELQVDPTNANAAYELGELHRKAGELPQARDFFQRALMHYPEFEEALVGLGRTLVALGEPERAVPPLLAAAKEDPADPVVQYQLAQAYRALGRTADQERALAEFARLRAAGAEKRAPLPETKRDVTRQEIDMKNPR